MNKQSKKIIVDLRQRILNSNVLDKPDAFQTKSQSSVTFLQFNTIGKSIL